MDRDGTTSSALTLQTERLTLRPWQASDAAFHRGLWLERDPRVPVRRRVSADGRPTIADLEGWVRDYDALPAPGLLVAELQRSGDPIGYCGLVANSVGRDDEPELAFEFAQRFWNRGYATEASRAILTCARAFGYRHLDSTVRAWNAASLRVLEKLGFAETGDVETDPVHGDSLLLRIAL